MDEYTRWVNGYDTGIRYFDDHLGQVLAELEKQGILDDTAIILTADHGENQGELNYYGAHRTGDAITHRVPMLVRWPGRTRGGSVKDSLHYHFDIAPTILDLLDIKKPTTWQGESFADQLASDADLGRDHLVLSQLACMCQRSVRFDDWILLRTWHDGFSGFPPVMLFNLADDPHEQHDLANDRPDVVKRGLSLLDDWQRRMLADSMHPQGMDPLHLVLNSPGPLHANRAVGERYCERLRATGRSRHAQAIEANWGVVEPLP